MLSKPTVYDSATYWQAYYLRGEGRTRARDGYVCYAPGCPSNAASYGAGWGTTEREALLAAKYWANQAPWVRVVPASRAPAYARDEAEVRCRT